MKKLIVGSLLFGLVSAAFAGPYGHHHNHGGGNWVAPALVGGLIGYAVASRQPQPVYVTASPAITGYYPPAVTYQPVPQTYRYETILDANCGCYRTVIVPN